MGRRAAARRRGGRQPIDGRLLRALRPAARPDRDRLLRRLVRRPPRGRPRLVRRQPARRSLGERGLRLVVRAPGRGGDRGAGHRRSADAGARDGEIPLNAWGAVGSNEAATEDYGYAASAELARLIAERAGPAGLASVWNAARQGDRGLSAAPARSRPGGSGAPPSPASGCPRTVVAKPPRPRLAPDRPTGAGCWICSRTGPARSYDDLWRSWVVRHEEATLLDARSAARRQYDELVARAGEWQAALDRPSP